MSYKVIARKYRPQTFKDIVGQQHVTKTLANAIQSGRVAHAYIFSGVRGVGKTTAARILAKALNCAKGTTAEPDDTCDSCREISAGTSLDVLEIDAASNRGIDQIRELREMVRYAPAASRYKVVILDEAHQLTDEASNALLKTLEEPPERVVFILATTRSEDLVETIKSRAQLFQFRALSFQEIAGQIEYICKEENLKIDSGAIAVLARAAEGSLRDGLSLLEQAIAYSGDELTDTAVRELLGVVAESILDDLVAAIASQSAERALSLVHRLIADGQNLQHFCRESIRHFRNLLVTRVCGANSNLIAAPEEERPRLAEQAAQFSEEDLTRFFNILLATDDDLRRKPDPRLHLELGLLKMVNAQRLAPLEEVLADLRGDGSKPPAPPKPTIPPVRNNPASSSAPSSASSASPFSTSASNSQATSSAGTGAATAARMAPERRAAIPVEPSISSALPVSPAPSVAPARTVIEAPVIEAPTTKSEAQSLEPTLVPSVEPIPAQPEPTVSASTMKSSVTSPGTATFSPSYAKSDEDTDSTSGIPSAAPIDESTSVSSASPTVAEIVPVSAETSSQIEAIKTALQSQKFLWSMAEHAHRWEIESGELRLFFPTESRVLAEMLQARDPMERFRKVLQQVVGQPLRVCVKLDGSKAVRPDPGSELRTRFEQDPIVRVMLEKFGGQISSVKRPGEE
jgi:DNA polymerase-3 subunit gamma/tau